MQDLPPENDEKRILLLALSGFNGKHTFNISTVKVSWDVINVLLNLRDYCLWLIMEILDFDLLENCEFLAIFTGEIL